MNATRIDNLGTLAAEIIAGYVLKSQRDICGWGAVVKFPFEKGEHSERVEFTRNDIAEWGYFKAYKLARLCCRLKDGREVSIVVSHQSRANAQWLKKISLRCCRYARYDALRWIPEVANV